MRNDPVVLLSLDRAGVSFGAVTALRGVSMAVAQGERIALVGANGSGKTTLLRLLHGLVTAQATPSGPAARQQAQHLRCGMLFQRPFLLNFSVATNVRLALWLAGVARPQRAERLHAVLERVGLGAHGHLQARALSGGQQQRLAFARALATHPDILFLDEPTSSLDPGAKREVEALIEQLGREGMTLVFSSHNLGQVKRLAKRVIYLQAGQLVVDLPTERFFNDALPPEAAQFLKGELPW